MTTFETWLQAALAAGVIFLILDGLWLGVIARGFIVKQMGDMLRQRVSLVPAALFYVIHTAGLVYFAILPALGAAGEGGDIAQAALHGAFIGLIAYGAYDFTNLATLKGFPVALGVVDVTWGTVLSAATAGGAVAVLGLF